MAVKRLPWPNMGAMGMLRGAVVCLMASALSIRAAGPEAPDVQGSARGGGRPSADVVVWLDAPNAPAGLQRGKAVLDQRNIAFTPHVLAVRVGTLVDFPNDDRVLHNVFSFRDGKVFDLGLYPVGTRKQVKFDKPGLSRIFCNIHPNMAAYVMAVDSPYFAVSANDGTFTIASVPDGSYTYHAWRAGDATLATGTFVNGTNARLAVEWPQTK
jgi:plastocyanin